ncbi:uncharacterized protein LOC144124050 [Amblyomma americanum]
MTASVEGVCESAASASACDKRMSWSPPTTESLIRLLESNLRHLRGTAHNAMVYAAITAELNAGLPSCVQPFTVKQVRLKVDDLNKKYPEFSFFLRKLRRQGKTIGSKDIEWEHYLSLHKFLGALATNDDQLVEKSFQVEAATDFAEGSQLLASWDGPVAAASTDGGDVGGGSSSTIPLPLNSTSATEARGNVAVEDSATTNERRKRPATSIMQQLLDLHKHEASTAGKAAKNPES